MMLAARTYCTKRKVKITTMHHAYLLMCTMTFPTCAVMTGIARCVAIPSCSMLADCINVPTPGRTWPLETEAPAAAIVWLVCGWKFDDVGVGYDVCTGAVTD